TPECRGTRRDSRYTRVTLRTPGGRGDLDGHRCGRRTGVPGDAGSVAYRTWQAHRIPAPDFYPVVALAQRHRFLHDGDERTDDLQRSSAPLLGNIRRQLRLRLVRNLQPRWARLSAYRARDVRDHGRAGHFGQSGGTAFAANGLPGLGDHTVVIQPRRRAPVAPVLCLGA